MDNRQEAMPPAPQPSLSPRTKLLIIAITWAAVGALAFLFASHRVSAHTWGKVLAICFLLGYPALAIISLVRSRRPGFSLPPRLQVYHSAIALNWVFAVTVYAAVHALDWNLERIGFRLIPMGKLVVWSVIIMVGCAVIGMALQWFIGLGWLPPPRAIKWFVPETTIERIVCLLLLAPSIGFCEELVFRGYLLHAIPDWLDAHGIVWAFALTCIAFGLGHAYQGLTGILAMTLFGAVLATVVICADTIVPAMLAHVVYDAVLLIWIAPRWDRREGSKVAHL